MNMQTLKTALSQFGLNPRDWKLRLQSKSTQEAQVRVLHRRDRDLCFVGLVADNKWLSLHLAD